MHAQFYRLDLRDVQDSNLKNFLFPVMMRQPCIVISNIFQSHVQNVLFLVLLLPDILLKSSKNWGKCIYHLNIIFFSSFVKGVNLC